DTRDTLPPALAELLAAPVGSKRVDLGGGLQAGREHERLWLERGPVELAGEIRWGDWTIRSELEGLRVRGWRPGDRLAGRGRQHPDVVRGAKGAPPGAGVGGARSRTCSSTRRCRARTARRGRSWCAATRSSQYPDWWSTRRCR